MASKNNSRTVRTQKKRTLTQQTISAISGLFKRSPKVAATHTSPTPAPIAQKTAVVVDSASEKALLDKLLAMPSDTERDIRLVNFAIHTPLAAMRWEAVQAVQGEAGWIKLNLEVAPKDRRVAKYVKEKLHLIQAKHAKNEAWLDFSQRYTDMAHAEVVDVRHFMELDKAFESAHNQHQFEVDRINAVQAWRSALQTKLQQQTLEQRDVQAHRDALKNIQQLAKTGEYSAQLQAQFDTLSQARATLPQARGILALQRLLIEIDELTPNVQAVLIKASQQAGHKQAIESLLNKLNTLNPAQADIPALRNAWRKEWTEFPVLRKQFDSKLDELAVKHSKAVEQRAQNYAQKSEWLKATQAQLEQALESGQGQLAVKLANDITAQIDLHTLYAQEPEQATVLERLLAQAREAKNLLWEGAGREREALIDKVQALAEKPLLVKYQAQALKDAQQAWKALKDKAGPAPHAQFVAFKTACDTAYEPVKVHQDNMRQVMAQGTAQRQAQIDELNALLARVDWAQADWAAVEQLRQEARAAWRSSLPSDYKQRSALSNAHDEVMALLDLQLGKARDAELARRHALTQEAWALADKPFAEQHSAARELMDRYQAQRSGVYIPRGADQAAWGAFKEAIDAVYSRRDEERKHLAHENAQALTTLIRTKTTVLEQLQTDTLSFAQDAKRLKQALDKALMAWDEPGRLPKNVGTHEGVNIETLVKTWLAAIDHAKSSLNQAHKHVQTQRTSLAWDFAHAQDTNDTQRVLELTQRVQDDEVLKKVLLQRQTATTAVLQTALLDAEIAASCPSPDQYQSARMQRQVQKLSDKLSGNARTGTQASFEAWLAALAFTGSTLNETGERLQALTHTFN